MIYEKTALFEKRALTNRGVISKIKMSNKNIELPSGCPVKVRFLLIICALWKGEAKWQQEKTIKAEH